MTMSMISRPLWGLVVAVFVSSLTSVSLRAGAREWTDTSGKYSVEASFVAADDALVVLETSDNELLIVQQDQLSSKDQEYVAEQLATEDAVALPEDKKGTAQNSHSSWRLRDGSTLEGQLLGFGSETLTVKRHRGDILVNQRKLQDLPRAYGKIMSDVVAHVDKTRVADVEDLDEHLADKGGGPFEYVVEGIQLELDSGDVITIPMSLLDPQDAKQISSGFARWKASQAENVSEKDRNDVKKRERLMLDSYGRYRGTHPVGPRRMRLLQLQLLAAEVGVTDVWEVALYPPIPYGYPNTVIVLAQNALIARKRALQRFPGWRVGATRKVND